MALVKPLQYMILTRKKTKYLARCTVQNKNKENFNSTNLLFRDSAPLQRIFNEFQTVLKIKALSALIQQKTCYCKIILPVVLHATFYLSILFATRGNQRPKNKQSKVFVVLWCRPHFIHAWSKKCQVWDLSL
jgi:hypothetical protein